MMLKIANQRYTFLVDLQAPWWNFFKPDVNVQELNMVFNEVVFWLNVINSIKIRWKFVFGTTQIVRQYELRQPIFGLLIEPLNETFALIWLLSYYHNLEMLATCIVCTLKASHNHLCGWVQSGAFSICEAQHMPISTQSQLQTHYGIS